jgi:Protein of unknown function (DUF2924)
LEQNKIIQPRPTRHEAVDRLLKELPTMERKDLLKLWRDLFDGARSTALHRETMIPILAYRIQEKAFGGLKPSTVRKLRELADESRIGEPSAQNSLRPKIGTRYVREHAGKMHEVTVHEADYASRPTRAAKLSSKPSLAHANGTSRSPQAKLRISRNWLLFTAFHLASSVCR